MVNAYSKVARPILVAALLGLFASVMAACGGPASSVTTPSASTLSVTHDIKPPENFKFITLDDNADPTFNQLLGINHDGVIAGYYGSGAPGHPNRGYTLAPPYTQGDYTNENFPGAVQTQVTAIDNRGDTAGFWVDSAGNNFGWIKWNGVFSSYRDPLTGTGTVNQILGLKDSGLAVGFYTDGHGVNHGFELNQNTGAFTEIAPPGGTNTTASALNDGGDVTGFTTISGAVVGFILKSGNYTQISYPGAAATTPFGINQYDQIVGSYVNKFGATKGFIVTSPLSGPTWQTVVDPNGIKTTVVNGLNNEEQLVGFYTDTGGNTHGFLANPQP